MLLCKALRQLKGVFLTVLRYIVKETAAVVVRLYNAVTVNTELLCSFNQFGIVFAALIDRCFFVLDCTGRQSGTLRGLHNISQHAAALDLNNRQQCTHMIRDTILLGVFLYKCLQGENFRG